MVHKVRPESSLKRKHHRTRKNDHRSKVKTHNRSGKRHTTEKSSSYETDSYRSDRSDRSIDWGWNWNFIPYLNQYRWEWSPNIPEFWNDWRYRYLGLQTRPIDPIVQSTNIITNVSNPSTTELKQSVDLSVNQPLKQIIDINTWKDLGIGIITMMIIMILNIRTKVITFLTFIVLFVLLKSIKIRTETQQKVVR